jgi:hypothetical protein
MVQRKRTASLAVQASVSCIYQHGKSEYLTLFSRCLSSTNILMDLCLLLRYAEIRRPRSISFIIITPISPPKISR